MRSLPHLPGVVSSGCMGLYFITSSGSYQHIRAVVTAGGAAAIATAITQFPTHRQTGDWCHALLNIAASSEEHALAVATSGGIRALIVVLRATQAYDDSDTAACCCLALGELAFGSEDRTAAIIAEGADAVAAAISVHYEDQHVVELCLSALLNMVVSSGSADVRASLANTIVKETQTFKGFHEIAEFCCLSLGELASRGHTEAVVAAGGVATVVGEVTDYMNDEYYRFDVVDDPLSISQVVENEVVILGVENLADILTLGTEQHVQAVVAAGGGRCVEAALHAHSHNADVAEWGCRALTALTLRSGKGLRLLSKDAATRAAAAVLALQAHPNNADVAEWGCRALASIASRLTAPQKQALSVNHGAVAVIAALRTHSNDAEVCEAASNALRLWPDAVLDAAL